MALNFLELFFGFILGIVSDLSAAKYRDFRTRPWVKGVPFVGERRLEASREAITQLDQLIADIGDMTDWLAERDSDVIDLARADLWRQMGYLWIEKQTCQAIYARRQEDRIWAVKQLSEADPELAIPALQLIAESHMAPETVRFLAQQLLRDLQ